MGEGRVQGEAWADHVRPCHSICLSEFMQTDRDKAGSSQPDRPPRPALCEFSPEGHQLG